MNLEEWTEHYIKSRDAFERKLVNLSKGKGQLVAEYKDRTVVFVCSDELPEKVPEGFATVVCLQKESNFKSLLNYFSEYSKHSGLTIIFANPKLNEKWLVKPAIHSSVADKSTLKTGLRALYDSVPGV